VKKTAAMTKSKVSKAKATNTEIVKSGTGDPTFAVAFGGGGARGLAHIHIIDVLNELGITPVAISGSSIGSIMGASMASGMSGQEVRDFTLSVMTNRVEVMNRLWKLRPGGLGGLIGQGWKFSQFDIEKIVESFVPQNLARDFSELKIPFTAIATDYYGQKPHIMNSGDLRTAVSASAAIPGVFKPVKRDERILIDGGICDPVPFEILSGKADHVIAIDVVGFPDGDETKMPGTIDILFGTSQLMMQSIISLKLKTGHPSIFLRPPVNDYRVLDFLKAKTILERTATVRDELKRAIEAVHQHHGKGA
jgi:NTE family protein